MFDPSQPSLDFWASLEPTVACESLFDVIVDRGSKYTVTYGVARSREEVEIFMKQLKKEKYFAKATHNTYAYRFRDASGAIGEGKNDDGETGAGMCILRELQRADFVGGIVVVTRYFWGIHLGTDRFKNVIDATKMVLQKVK